MFEFKSFGEQVSKNAEKEMHIEQEHAKKQISEALDFYYISPDKRKWLLELEQKENLSQSDIDEVKEFNIVAREATESHLEQIGMTVELNKFFFQAIQDGDKRIIDNIVAISEQEISRREALPTTVSKYACFDLDEDGCIESYHPERDLERAELHNSIIESFFDEVESVEMSEILIVGGLPGAGKSTSVNMMKKESNNMVVIDPDIIKPKLMENFDEENSKHVLAAHEESSWLAKRLFAEARQRNVNIVYDGMFSNTEKFRKIMNDALEDDYKTSLIFVHGGAESWRRNTLLRPRALTPKIYKEGLKGYKTLQELINHPALNNVIITDNSSRDSVDAKIIFDSNEDILEDFESLYKRYPEFQKFLNLVD